MTLISGKCHDYCYGCQENVGRIWDKYDRSQTDVRQLLGKCSLKVRWTSENVS